MTHHKHRDRSWPALPQPLPEGAQVIDNHTHVASVVNYSQYMSSEAAARGQYDVPVYSTEELLRRAASVGVTGIIDDACEYPHLRTAINMAKAYPGQVHAGVAIHPNEAVAHGRRAQMGPDGLEPHYMPWHDIPFDEAIAEVDRLARENPREVVVIGETGLDYFRCGEDARRYQIEAFRAHIALAKELNLPMQIHDRDAHEDCIATLLRDGAPERTVFHSFSGDARMGRICKENGWYMSFSGTVSYKGNDGIREALALADPTRILVETDAPYLTPMPYRGRTNSPSMIPYTLRAMAQVRGCSVEEVARITRRNARECYGI